MPARHPLASDHLRPSALSSVQADAGTSLVVWVLQYKVEEIERVLVAQEGKQYAIEACVATTATYGDRMRSVVKSKYARLCACISWGA